MYADPAVKDAWSGRAGTPDQIKAAFARTHVDRLDDLCYHAVVRKADQQLLGLMGFQRYEADEDANWIVFEHGPPAGWRSPDLVEVELTYAFGRAYWGNRYATEAGRAMIAYGFGEMGIARIVSGTRGANLRSIALMQRLGFAVQRNLSPNLQGRDADAHAIVGVLENHALLASRRYR